MEMWWFCGGSTGCETVNLSRQLEEWKRAIRDPPNSPLPPDSSSNCARDHHSFASAHHVYSHNTRLAAPPYLACFSLKCLRHHRSSRSHRTTAHQLSVPLDQLGHPHPHFPSEDLILRLLARALPLRKNPSQTRQMAQVSAVVTRLAT